MAPTISAIRKRGLREALRHLRSRSDAGSGGCGASLLRSRSGGLSGGRSAGAVGWVVGSMGLLAHSSVLLQTFFGIADGARQLYFGEIMLVQARDVTFIGAGHAFLGLNDFEIIRHSGKKTVAGLV